MTSLITNSSAINALSALRSVGRGLQTTQDRISSGLSITSGKDNAAYFQISETMKGDSATYNSVNEGLTMTKNSVATARLGAESFQDLAQAFVQRVAFAQGATQGEAEVGNELNEIVKQMETTIIQSTFNGDDMVGAGLAVSGVTPSAVDAATGVLSPTAEVTTTRNVVTGVSRGGGSFSATTITVETQDLSAMLADFEGLATGFAANAQNATTGKDFLAGALTASESVLAKATSAATNLGLAEKSIENQQNFLTKLVDNIDSGVGSMIDANMEEEAARLQALQVQQQLATQSLSIANSAPQNIMSLFR
jgi:flagellin